jgi:long-chain acyl-CoA synthetase
MVVGDAQPYIACLVTLDPRRCRRGCRTTTSRSPPPRSSRRTLTSSRRSSGRSTTRTRRLPGRGDQALQDPAGRLHEEGGQLTPTLKLKRNIVAKEFAGDIDALYS